ncbi:ABC transporter permease [Castellaniella defragrans]|uniref:Transport permease protein n=1 Tax=Castellaniella defragrans TaxID=75697 RepID=A0A7W9WNT1_CASDE|nr:ABC transporter permease [Castellaniella defragrans]MBB6084096.1 lipopolysaccharide transport system permease protein [Castellaniella defragrans]
MHFPLDSTLSTQFSALWRHRQLIARMAWRDILGRYRGSAGGLAWSLFTPILMLAVYTVVFSGIFKARWSADSTSPLDYALQLFVGLIIHGLAAECLNRAPGLVVGNVSYVKRVLFPLDTLPVVNLLSALFHAAISLVVLLLFFAVLEHRLPLTALWLPVVILPYLLMLAGISWLLAALGVYLRDISQLMGLVTMVLMFLSPVFYPVSNLPARFHAFFQINPLTLIIEQARAVTLQGRAPDLAALGLYLLVAAVVAWAGLAAFHKMKKGFADVL